MLPRSRLLLLSAAAVVGVLVVGTGAALASGGDEIPGGTTVRAVDVGGLTRAEAAVLLEDAFDTEQSSSISLVAQDEVLQLDPTAAGISLDVDATVDAALDAGVVDRLLSRFGAGREIDPVPSYDESRLSAELARLAEGFDREAREGAVRFTPEGVPVEARPITGRALDISGAVEALRSSYLSQRVEVPVDVDEVSTTDEDVREARDEIAIPALAAPITVDVEGDDLVVEPLDIAKSLSLEAVDGKITPVIREDDLHERVEGKLRMVGTPAVDATFDVSSGKPVVVPSKTGMSVSASDLADAVLEVLTDDAPRTTTAELSVSQPRVSTETARGLGVKEVIGTFTSRHPCCAARVTNIQRMADIVDGYVLRPGDQFDLNGYVGPRDEARGFKPAPMILDGEFRDSVGGGVSQFATTIYNAVYFAGLKVDAHQPHSVYIDRYPAGREATVDFGSIDMAWTNDTDVPILVRASSTATSVTVSLFGDNGGRRVQARSGPRQDVPGRDFAVTVTRIIRRPGRRVSREAYTTTYDRPPTADPPTAE